MALLSFTNAAVDVARERSKSSPHLLRTPNFVGTFDAFFNRYVVTPGVRRNTGVTPQYLASWDDLPTELSMVRPRNGGLGIRLSRWTRARDGTIGLDESRLGYEERRAWNQVSQWTRENINRRGTELIEGLLAKHVYSAEESRRLALEYLDPPDAILRNRLVTRFNEVIVDEFQDCDVVEHSILRQLQQAGTHVVTVADPDQAIYEFRQAGPSDLYAKYRAGMTDNEVVTLTTCYRSRPVICAAVPSLRTTPNAIESNDPHDTTFPAIHVVVGRGHAAETAGRGILNEAGLDAAMCRVIAHRRSDAQSLRRGSTELVPTTTVLGNVLVAAAQFLTATDTKHRLQAVGRIEQRILDQFDWGPEGQSADKSER
ncbi:MAG: UvrD-helicase domain-containing protein, partial [Rubrobacteraceae bacterium]